MTCESMEERVIAVTNESNSNTNLRHLNVHLLPRVHSHGRLGMERAVALAAQVLLAHGAA